jgi:uncharacterized protein
MAAITQCKMAGSSGGEKGPAPIGAFDQAAKAVSDHFAIEAIDDREDHGEERMNLIGMCEGVILHVTYTERGERIRIISARRAERHEQNNYFRANTR